MAATSRHRHIRYLSQPRHFCGTQDLAVALASMPRAPRYKLQDIAPASAARGTVVNGQNHTDCTVPEPTEYSVAYDSYDSMFGDALSVEITLIKRMAGHATRGAAQL